MNDTPVTLPMRTQSRTQASPHACYLRSQRPDDASRSGIDRFRI